MRPLKTFFNEKTGLATCFFCGKTREMPPARNVELFLTATMSFEKAHQNCKAANEEKPLFS